MYVCHRAGICIHTSHTHTHRHVSRICFQKYALRVTELESAYTYTHTHIRRFLASVFQKYALRVTELESAYSVLIRVFSWAHAHAQESRGITDKTDKTPPKMSMPTTFSQRLGHVDAVEHHTFTFESLGEACFIISGKRTDDMMLEHMFEEAATFRASDAGTCVCMCVCVCMHACVCVCM
jgi:hypothetical protein